MTPERKLGLEDLRRLIEQARALPGTGQLGPAQAGAVLLALAEASLRRGDRAGAVHALDGLLATLAADHPQRGEVQALRDAAVDAAPVGLLDGLEPAERAMAPGYLLMAAQDGELSPEETAALEDRLASADPGLRVEWAWLERARAAMTRVALSDPPGEAWDGLFAAMRARAGVRPAPSAAESVSRLKALRSGDVEQVRARIAASTSKVSLGDLERRGFRQVKVLRAGDINQLIFKAVERVFARQARGLSDEERERIIGEARAELDQHLAAMRELQTEAQRVAAERDALLRGRDGDEGPIPRSVRRGGVVAAGLCVRAPDAPNGDWFDLVERGADGLDVVVGDPSGRGVAAAVALGCARSALLGLAGLDASPAQVLAAANRALCRTLPSGSFVSGVLARCDGAGRLVVASAGHEPAVVYRAREGRAEAVKLGGVVLGVVDRGSAFMTESALELGPGDALVLVTDGVTEALAPDDEPFDQERMLEAVARHGHLDPESLVAAVADEVRRWAGYRPLHDDLVVVAVQRVALERPAGLRGLVRAVRDLVTGAGPAPSLAEEPADAPDAAGGDDLDTEPRLFRSALEPDPDDAEEMFERALDDIFDGDDGLRGDDVDWLDERGDGGPGGR